MSRPGDLKSSGTQGLRILDIAAMVVGYGLAALGLRAFWPASVRPSLALGVMLAVAFAWLGLAMSGPFVLLLDIPRRREPAGPDGLPPDPRPEPPGYTAAETAWLLVGAYWVAVTLIIVPARLPSQTVPLLGVVPIVAAVLLWILSPRGRPDHRRRPGWTHRTAVLVLASWPVAWCALIALTSAVL
jgi:hypothetical protein